MLVCGIDPGLKGGVVLLTEKFSVFDWAMLPTKPITATKRRIDGVKLYKWLASANQPIGGAMLEEPIPMPGQRSVGMMQIGVGWGDVRTAVEIADILLATVRPKVWKAALGLGTELEDIEAMSDIYWPAETATQWRGPNGGLLDGVCEAALLARYGIQRGYFVTRENRRTRL